MPWTPEDVEQAVDSERIVIFGKGTKEAPRCGFSQRAYMTMAQLGKPFEVIDILSDPSIRPALVEYSDWPTTPQVFVDGELIGGSDITVELYEKGELQEKVEAAFADEEATEEEATGASAG